MNLSEKKAILKSFLEKRGLADFEIKRILGRADGAIMNCIDNYLSWSESSLGYFKCKLICIDWLGFLYSVSDDESKDKIKSYLKNLAKGYHHGDDVSAKMHDGRFRLRAFRYLK